MSGGAGGTGGLGRLTHFPQTLTAVFAAYYYRAAFGDCVVLTHAQKVMVRRGPTLS